MDDVMPLVSVIIPVYRVEKYLPECLESVINQTYKNLEIILVDDGSPDNCGKICDEYAENDNRIIVIHKKNGGLSSARNAGIDISTGEWIYFCDSDDIIEHELIGTVLSKLISDKSDMCFFDYDRFCGHNKTSHQTIKSDENFFNNTNDIKILLTYFSEMGSACYYIAKASIIKENVRFADGIKYLEDELFKFQLYSYINSFSYVHKVLYHYRAVENSITQDYSNRQDYLDIVFFVNHVMKEAILNGNYPENALIVPNTRFICRFNTIVRTAFQNKFSFKCDFEMIKKYMNSSDYCQALMNYDKNTVFGFSNMIYILVKKPNRFFITLIYMLTKIKTLIKKA